MGARETIPNDLVSCTSDEQIKASRREQTGRFVIVFREGATSEALKLMRSLNFQIALSPASEMTVLRDDEVLNADAIVLEALGVAIVAGEPERISQLRELTKSLDGPILSVEPEKIRHALNGTNTGIETGRAATVSVATVARQFEYDESQLTWGLQATKVDTSKFSGRGVRIAVLDTGIDFRTDSNGNISYHPDFENRQISTTSFVTGAKTAKDGVGHGTHCTGIACGPLKPKVLPRYGIAYDADIFVAKVLDDENGDGLDGWILAGIEWAVKNGCQIISMSLGTSKTAGDPFSVVYETVAQRALAAGTLIVAAAGNDSNRFQQKICPVDEPADCPSIMAVAALESDLDVTYNSNAGVNANGGVVDIAAPGRLVFSSYFTPPGYEYLSGTSMAAPHVAGIAALYHEACGVAGNVLWDMILENARQMGLSSQDVGAGLVQAP